VLNGKLARLDRQLLGIYSGVQSDCVATVRYSS
jgi:hypothetical protein